MDYEHPDDYSKEKRITKAPSNFAYVPAMGAILGIAGMFFGVPTFLF